MVDTAYQPVDENGATLDQGVAAARLPLSFLSRLIPAAISNLYPDPTQEGAAGYVPAVAARGYDFANTALDAVQRVLPYVNSGVPSAALQSIIPQGPLPQPVQLPGVDTAHAISENALAAANKDFPTAIQPQTPLEDIAGHAGELTGEAGIMLPEKLLAGASKPLLGLVAPTMVAPKTMAAISTGAAALQGSSLDPNSDGSNMPPLPPPVPNLVPPSNDPALHIGMDIPTPHTDAETGVTRAEAIGAAALTLGAAFVAHRSVNFLSGLRSAATDVDALAQQLRRGAGDATVLNEPLISPTTPGQTPAVRLATATQDSTAGLQAFVEAGESNPSIAQLSRAQTGMLSNSGAWGDRLQEFVATGKDPISGVRMPSYLGHWEKLASADDAAKQQYNLARYASDELDNRTNILNKSISSGQPLPQPDATRVGFGAYDDAQLRQIVTDANNNPAVRALLAERQVMNARLVEVMEAQGILTAPERARLLADHPNYLPSADIEGVISNPFRARNLDNMSGVDLANVPAWELDKQHIEAVHRAMENNRLMDTLISHAYDFQKANGGPKLVQPSITTEGEFIPKDDGSTVALRVNGELQHHEILAPDLLHLITQPNIVSSTMLGTLQSMKNLYQSSTTGLVAALVGHPFAIKGAIYNNVAGSLNRPAGMSFGLVDDFAQRVSNGLLELRGDPTGAIGQSYAVLADATSMIANKLARNLDKTMPNAAQTTLRTFFGDPAVDAMASRLQSMYEASVVAEMRSTGSRGSAGYSSAAIDAQQIANNGQRTSVINNMVPELFRTTGLLGDTMPMFVRANDLFREVNSLLTESAQSHFVRINRGKEIPTDVLHYEARQLAGDPATRGASKAAQGISAVAPYSNISLQGLVRVGRALAENPVSFPLGLVTYLGTTALASHYSAMLNGPATIANQTNEMSNADLARKPKFYTSDNPDTAAIFELPQEFSMFYPMIAAGMHDILQMPAHADNPDIANWALNNMHNFFSKYITHSEVKQTMNGLGQAVTPSLPPIASTALSVLGGVNLDLNPYNLAYKNGNPSMVGRITIPTQSKATVPGAPAGGDSITGAINGGTIEQIVKGMLSIAGSAIIDGVHSWHNGTEKGMDNYFKLGALADQAGRRFHESVPLANGLLWNADNRLASQNALTEQVQNKLKALEPLTSAASDERFAGMPRARGSLELPTPDVSKVPQDPTMQQLYYMGGGYKKIIDSKLMPLISDQRKAMKAIDENSVQPMDQKIELKNATQRKINKAYSGLADMLTQLELGMSKTVGKRVHVEDIDWSKGPEQFH